MVGKCHYNSNQSQEDTLLGEVFQRCNLKWSYKVLQNKKILLVLFVMEVIFVSTSNILNSKYREWLAVTTFIFLFSIRLRFPKHTSFRDVLNRMYVLAMHVWECIGSWKNYITKSTKQNWIQNFLVNVKHTILYSSFLTLTYIILTLRTLKFTSCVLSCRNFRCYHHGQPGDPPLPHLCPNLTYWS